MTDKAIRAALLTTKRVDTKSENIADYVADLLRQGRASEVTDDLMAQADPQRLHQHYTSGNTGQPMPMDYASRMERAAQMGMTHKGYHSTLREIQKFDPTGGFYGHTGTSGISTTDNPKAASRYLDRYGNIDYKGQPFQKNIIPTLANIGNSDVRNEPYPGPSKMGFPLPEGYVPTHERFGFDSAQFPDSISAAGSVKHSDAKNAIRSTETVMSDPTNIRSQFARFDPRLGHLAHLSASTGGAMDLSRAVMAKDRAGGQIAPSKFMPGVPRQVHKDGGRAAFMQGNHPDVPPVMYHGTGAAKDFSSFSLPGNKTKRKTGGNAIYLSTSPETAGTFANYGESPRIIPAHVSAKNPFDFRNPDHLDALQRALTKNFKSWFPGAMYGPNAAMNWMKSGDFGLLENDNVRSWMKRHGHDGYFVTEGEGRPLNLAVFKPEQIKSAIGNNGDFDPTNPDITKSNGGEVDEPITAYHGSPHSFDKFDISKIGTGVMEWYQGQE